AITVNARLYSDARPSSSSVMMDENSTVTSQTAPTPPAPTIINPSLILDRTPLDYILTSQSYDTLVYQRSSNPRTVTVPYILLTNSQFIPLSCSQVHAALFYSRTP